MASGKICIIGGGIIGLMNGWYLHRAGFDVMILDADDITDNTSFGNAGLLSAFEKDPLAHPGVLLATVKLMLQGRSPLSFAPTLDPLLYRWLIRFIASATPQRLKKTLALFERYGTMGMEGYRQLFEDGIEYELHTDGLLLVYTETKSYAAKLKQMKGNPHHHVLSKAEIERALPLAKQDKIEGALLLDRDAYLDPETLMLGLKKRLQDAGVALHTGQRVVALERDDKRIIAATTATQRYEADTFVLATGADAGLARTLGRTLMMVPAKGYSVTFGMDAALKPSTAALFVDIFTALSPRDTSVRITGKLELGRHDTIAHPKIIDRIVRTLKEYTVDFELRDPKPWAGLRPLTPNDMPLIGRDAEYGNLIYATGLGWLGITLAPAIAHILRDQITQNLPNEASPDILLLSGFYQG